MHSAIQGEFAARKRLLYDRDCGVFERGHGGRVGLGNKVGGGKGEKLGEVLLLARIDLSSLNKGKRRNASRGFA